MAWILNDYSQNYLADVSDDHDQDALPHEHGPTWSKKRSILYLVVATVMVAFVSEWLVGVLEPISHEYGLSELFIGAFLVAIIGNAAEHSATIMLAMKNKIGAAVEIAVGGPADRPVRRSRARVHQLLPRGYDGSRVHHAGTGRHRRRRIHCQIHYAGRCFQLV